MNVCILVVQSIAIAEGAPLIALLMLPVSIIGAMALAYQRCVNIGMNPWWCLGLIVPILNIFVGLRCIAYPEGYEHHKTLDTPAKVLIGLFLAAFVFALFAIVIVLAGRH